MSATSIAKYLIGASNIKYEVLDTIFRDVPIRNDIINLYIDTDYVFHRLYRNNTNSDLYAVDSNVLVMDIVVTVINMIGHYRRYFATRLHKDNRIFLLFNTKIPAYQKHCYDSYGQTYYEKYKRNNKDYGEITAVIQSAYKFIKSIIVYFEGLYCIDNSGIDNLTAIQHIRLNEVTKNDYSIIFTRNLLACQLISDNCSVLYTKRDDSYMITDKDPYEAILAGKKTTSGELTASMIPFCFGLSGYTERGIESPACRGIVSGVKKVKKLMDDGKINPNSSNSSFIEAIENDFMSDELDDIKSLLNAITISLSKKALTSNQKEQIMSGIYDLYDQEGIDKINEMLMNLNSDGDIIDSINLNMTVDNNSYYDGEWSM